MTDNPVTRRRFFQSLAASALVAGVPLPAAFPRQCEFDSGHIAWEYFARLDMKALVIDPDVWVAVAT